MRSLTRALLFFVTLVTAINSYSDDLSIAEEDYLNGWYEDALPVFLSYGTPGLQSQNGDPIAQYYLGRMFYYGEGVEQNLAEAMKWYLLSSGQGDPDATLAIGFMYEVGDGVEISLETAIEWFKLALERGAVNAGAAIAVTHLYDESGIYKDVSKGLEMLREHSEKGSVDAQYYLGAAYYEDKVISRDLGASLKYLRMAEEQGDEEALELISWIYNEDELQKSYLDYIGELKLSIEHEQAFRCENITWTLALDYLLFADEIGNQRLARFAQVALDRINEFGSSLNSEVYSDEDYYQNQAFREIDYWLAGLYAFENEEIKARVQQNSGENIKEDAVILNRIESQVGISEIIFHNSFYEYYAAISENDRLRMWDDCVTKYMPDGIFSSDIGAESLSEALAEGETLESSESFLRRWVTRPLRLISEIDICQRDFDTAGGIAIGTAATALAAAPSAIVVATNVAATVATDSFLYVLASNSVAVAVMPAIAPAITIAAIAGSTVYLTTKGYCYLKD